MKILLLVALVAASQAVEYRVTVKTADEKWADSDGRFYAAILGYKQYDVLDLGHIDNPRKDDFEKGQTDVFRFENSKDVGKIACVIIRTASGSKDKWLIDTIQVDSTSDIYGFKAVNKGRVWLSADKTEGEFGLLFCRS